MIPETPVNPAPDEHQGRLLRNLLAMRTSLAITQMQTGRCGRHLEEIDEALAGLGHDMQSTVARAADRMRRAALLPRLVSKRSHGAHRPSARAIPRG